MTPFDFFQNKQTFAVIVRPSKLKTEITTIDTQTNTIYINLAAKAQEGKANNELILFLKKTYNITCQIKTGKNSKRKLLRKLDS